MGAYIGQEFNTILARHHHIYDQHIKGKTIKKMTRGICVGGVCDTEPTFGQEATKQLTQAVIIINHQYMRLVFHIAALLNPDYLFWSIPSYQNVTSYLD